MNISEMDIKSLKSLAYDEYVKLQITQNNLQLLNTEIAKKSKEVKESSGGNNV